MGNIRLTCEEKSYKSCDQPRRNASIKNEKGEIQFETIICTTCFGIVASTKVEAEKKAKKTEPKVQEAKVAELPQPDGESNPVEKTVAEPEKTKKEGLLTKEEEVEKMILEMENNSNTAVEMLLAMKTKFGMSNPQAASFLRDRQQSKTVKAVAEPEKQQAEPVQEQKQEEQQTAVEQPQVAETVPSPLPEKEAAEREASPIKPPTVKSIPETQGEFPINFFELIRETRSYRFKLHTPDGIEFVYEVTPRPEKYEHVEKNPDAFDGKNLIFKYSKVDDADCPIEPQLLGVK